MKFYDTSNSLYAHITRLITNHAPIGKYRLKFFSKESIICLCSKYPIEMRRHILYKYSQYNKSWNLKRKSLKDVLTFLEFNSRAFCFQDSIMREGAFSSYLSRYVVTTIVYYYILCKKIVDFLKKKKTRATYI